MALLYDRRYQLTVAAGGLQKSWSDLDLSFRVSKTITSEPNELELTLFGLNDDSRALLQAPNATIILEAGYQEEYGVIFSGAIGDVQEDGSFPDQAVVVRASDGASQMRQTPMSISISAGLSGKEALNQVLKATGLKAADSALSEIRTLTRGIALVGSPATILDAITAAQGISWSVQDGEVHVLPATGSGVIVVVDEPIGRLSKRTEAGKTLISFRTLLRAAIRPGVLVKVGGYQVVAQTVEHTGELPGQSWYTDVEGLLR